MGKKSLNFIHFQIVLRLQHKYFIITSMNESVVILHMPTFELMCHKTSLCQKRFDKLARTVF